MVDTKRARVTISGRVQGVFFRVSCAREARDRGLSGSVRNLADDRVEAVFEGASADVDAMVTWCAHGPPDARVDRVETTPEPLEGGDGFRIEG